MSIRKKKVVMFQLPYLEFRSIKMWGNIPFGAAMLKGMAQQEGLLDRFDIEILPPALANHAGDAWLIDYLETAQPDIICATLYLWNAERSIHIAEQLKTRLPNLLFIVGGPEVCDDSFYIIGNQAVDYGCMGEGEELFVTILRAVADDRDPTRVPGLFWRRGGNMFLTPGRGSVEKLDRLPSPLRMGLLQLRNEPIVSYETMRGCAYSCSYCTTGMIPSRFFPAGRVVEEISLLYENRVSSVRLVCSNFLRHPEFFTICHELARINAGRSMSFICFSYAGDITREKAKALKACNFNTVEIGLQTVNASTLKALQRPPFNESRFLEGLAHLRDVGIDFSIDLIAGLPGESIQDVEKSIAFMKEHRVRKYNIFPLQILPGSPLRKKAREMGIEVAPRPPYRVTGTPTMTQAQIQSCVSKEQIERKDFFFELAQEFRLPRFCAFKHTENQTPPPHRTAAPVTKLLVSSATNIKRFAETAVRKFGANVVMVFSNPGESLVSLSGIVEAVCHANPFCQIMPVFKIGTSAELDDVLQQCRRISMRNVVNKTVIKNDSYSGEEVALPKGFTLYKEIHIGSPGDMEKIYNCGDSNILIDLSPQLDPVSLRSTLEQFVTSGKNIQYKNFALYYLDYQLRQRQLGKPERIHAPVDIGNIVTLDVNGALAPHMLHEQHMSLEIAHMQMLFMRLLGSTTANSNTRSFV